MLRIVGDDWQELCNGIACEDCPFGGERTCKLSKWFSRQPKCEDGLKLSPIANITFDEDKVREICEEVISRFTTRCPNCGTEIKPRQN